MAELEIPDPSVVILVGAAGAGKSTFAARHFPQGAVLSSDAMREAISGDAADQSATRPAFEALHRALEQRLAAGCLTVVDATNLTPAARQTVRTIAARHRTPVIVIVLDYPGAIVHARNAARQGRQVPDAVVSRHLGQLRRAMDDGDLDREGYARVVVLRDPAESAALTVRRVASPTG
jgi:protein phosphatase